MSLPARVRICEVGPRDGFQMERAIIPTELKVEVIDAVSAAGVATIEATSFVSPKVIPQMADADQVMARIARRPGTSYVALVPNLRGLERAIDAGADGVRLVVCVTDTYNRHNVGMTVDQSARDLEAMLERARPAAMPVAAVIAVAFGCPFEGAVEPRRVIELARRFAQLGVTTLGVADSVGVANPVAVRRLMSELRAALPEVDFFLHLHDTRGMGLANVVAALEAGVDAFDASIGGLGGCPITTVSSGNVSSEDLVHLCEEMGISTGVDLDRLRQASRLIARFLSRDLPSHVLTAGTRAELFAKAASGS